MVQQNPPNLDNFNSLIDKATEAIICGPQCQKDKTANELKQKYLNSKTNLQTAPNQVQIAAKNYYTFTQGDAGYNEYLETQLHDKAEKIADIYQTNFNADVDKANTEIDTYNGLYINFANIFELYTNYKTENIKLEKEFKNTTSDILTNDRKTFYEDQGIDNLNFYYSIIKWLYIIVAIGFIISLFAINSSLKFIQKIVIIVMLISYPFISSKLLGFVISLYYGIIGILPKNLHRTL
jgi:hypothetical protein